MGGFAAALPVIQAIAPIAGTLLGGGSAPAPAAPPPPPAPAPAPPAPTVSSAPEAGLETPVVDTEAARVRAAKRRKAAADAQLFSLSDTSESSVLTKSLLGD